jgi:hypothetical protein
MRDLLCGLDNTSTTARALLRVLQLILKLSLIYVIGESIFKKKTTSKKLENSKISCSCTCFLVDYPSCVVLGRAKTKGHIHNLEQCAANPRGGAEARLFPSKQ